jgi:hypothetical protein
MRHGKLALFAANSRANSAVETNQLMPLLGYVQCQDAMLAVRMADHVYAVADVAQAYAQRAALPRAAVRHGRAFGRRAQRAVHAGQPVAAA